MPFAEDFTKAGIKSRLTQKAAEMWGYSEADMEGFDPLVQLLLEACAVEFEKIGQELNNTQHRLVERLAGLLNPDVVDAPRPAHAVAQAHPREPESVLPADAQFAFQRSAMGRAVPAAPMFFSPLQATRLVDGAVRYLATDQQVWRVEGAGQKRLLAESGLLVPAQHRRLWLGLELHPEVASLADLAFYFDWLNEPRREAYLSFLPGEAWLLDGQPLAVSEQHSALDAPPSALHQEYDFLHQVEQHVQAVYEAGFVRLGQSSTASLGTHLHQPFPDALAPQFAPEFVQTLSQPLIWLEVRFSHALPAEALASISCGLNCFPVVNRRLNKRLFRLQPALNIFPLDTEEAFLAIREVYSLRNVVFRSTTLNDLREGLTDTYLLRAHGTGRFDTRTGQEALLELLELLRDESRAFTATGTDFVANTLRELNQNLARLEERLNQTGAATTREPVPYILLRPRDSNDSVYLEYWSSNGEAGNRLPAGTQLQVYDGHYLDAVQLMTTTTGGRERPRPEERIHVLRKNLLSRNRIVTLEDIRAACWAELGNELQQVHLEKGFRNGTTPTAGFVRCIRVQLTPAAGSRLSGPEWQRAAAELQVTLARQSAMNLPYEVSVLLAG